MSARTAGRPAVVDARAHEMVARAEKAGRLADAFTDHARRVGADTPALVAGLAVAVDTSVWHDVAELAGIRRPSDLTIACAQVALRRRADQAGVDPTDGLPR